MRQTQTSAMIYLGIKGTVIALDRRTGVEQWRTPLKGMDFVNVTMDDDSIYAAARGEMFCLDPISGRILWTNQLPGMGWGMITMAGESIRQGSIAPMMARRAADQQAANGASTGAAT